MWRRSASFVLPSTKATSVIWAILLDRFPGRLGGHCAARIPCGHHSLRRRYWKVSSWLSHDPKKMLTAHASGLECYQPDDSRETRMLGRSIRRNRFISDYIFKNTGELRSAKQIGSRLQQLRESVGGLNSMSSGNYEVELIFTVISAFGKVEGHASNFNESGSKATSMSTIRSPSLIGISSNRADPIRIERVGARFSCPPEFN